MIDMDPEDRAASLSFRQLKLFESVGRLNSVRRASEECNLSQPAVTQALAKLEQQVGAVLLERRASGSYLNELGEIFHRRATRLFEQFEEALIALGVPGGREAAT
jgi:LysR family transcriptional regulator of gallate degradation